MKIILNTLLIHMEIISCLYYSNNIHVQISDLIFHFLKNKKEKYYVTEDNDNPPCPFPHLTAALYPFIFI